MKKYLILLISAFIFASCNLLQGPGGRPRDIYFRVIFFTNYNGNFDLYTADLDGSNVKQLTFDTGSDRHGVYSPDGSIIAFTSDRGDGHYRVYLMNSDGSNIRALNSSYECNNPSFSPDSQYVYYQCAPSLYGYPSIYRSDLAGNEILINSGYPQNRYPTVSPDGTKIVFACFTGASSDICMQNADGTGTPTIIAGPSNFGGNKEEYPVFSPNGQKIIFTSDKSGSTEIWETDLNSSYYKQLTSLGATVEYPHFDKYGNKIVFSSNHATVWGIYSINSDGSGLSTVLNTADVERFPSFSPVLED